MANLAEALTQHDKVRRSIDIPLFYGRKDKDSISPHQLLERINRAKRVANWTRKESATNFIYVCGTGPFRGPTRLKIFQILIKMIGHKYKLNFWPPMRPNLRLARCVPASKT